MVQSLKENKTLKNALDAMKNTPIPVAVRMVDTGIGVRLPYIESSTVGEVAGKFSKASTAAKDDAYQLAKGSGGSGVSKEGSVAKGTGDIDNPIRTYRGVELQNIDPVYIADQRTVVEMPFVGKGEKYTNAEGWRRDLKYFWSELLDRHPEAFSPNNRAIIEGRNPFTDSPVNDKVFREYFSQYDVKGVRGDKLVHHHIGGGGQAFPVPQKLHPGSGGIHNIEKEAGIWGKDKIYSELLQKLIKE
ncbi:hypothetical protein PDQ36_13040 [Bacillus cereus]|nr:MULTISPECIES: hypothetical protein [Bacillus cereus group]MCU7754203.1 hypothetical protein [Bacillus cereus]MDA2624229.1 hypothetical protein [Bacillus cereus]MDF3553671.1 hypothetical protein [Bacillus cereus]UXP12382.1 hypothetical protein N7988_16340 [Bacillus cereus]